jgi:hypothetical protein
MSIESKKIFCDAYQRNIGGRLTAKDMIKCIDRHEAGEPCEDALIINAWLIWCEAIGFAKKPTP